MSTSTHRGVWYSQPATLESAVSRVFGRVVSAAGIVGIAASLFVSMEIPATAANGCPLPADAYAGGDGSESNPYQIATPAQMLRLAITTTELYSSHFTQTANINMSGCVWEPIGGTPIGDTIGPWFSGTYDGDGFEVSNLVSDPSSNYPLGFFGKVRNAVIRDVVIVNSTLIGNDYVGGLMGVAEDTIVSHVTVDDVVVDTPNVAGGLIGYSELGVINITNVSVSGKVTAVDYAGGLIGYSAGKVVIVGVETDVEVFASRVFAGGVIGYSNGVTELANASVSGTVGASDYAGGVTGYSLGPSEISATSASVAVTAVSNHAGGLIGYSNGSAAITQSSVTGTVSAGNYVGGLIGYSFGASEISATSASVVVTAEDDYAGGFIGYSNGSATITLVSASGSVKADNYAGGLIGQSLPDTVVSYSSSTAEVLAKTDYAGGLLGSSDEDTSVLDSSASGDVTSDGWAGGVIGFAFGTTFSRSFSDGDVNSDGPAGGLVGAGWEIEISDSYAAGDVQAVEGFAGGLVGEAVDVVLSNTYATGRVEGKLGAGGLIGQAGFTSVVDSHARNTAVVSPNFIGGLIGLPFNLGDEVTVTNSFWTTEALDAAPTNVAGTGKTTAQLTSLVTFTETATEGLDTPWKIVGGWLAYEAGVSVWGMCPQENSGYPFLLWQFDSNPCVAPGGEVSGSRTSPSPLSSVNDHATLAATGVSDSLKLWGLIVSALMVSTGVGMVRRQRRHWQPTETRQG